ncbi:MAG: GGDEF domain-containing protein [Ruegeria sp.]|uniref:GGDEF domain-containing protein n=1 Tax=Ruegeria sp. TaxID=1879320 RepID=UPI00349EBA56
MAELYTPVIANGQFVGAVEFYSDITDLRNLFIMRVRLSPAVDVDHFKKFNDTEGNDAGDMVLRAVSSVLVQGCDGDEVACRMGGEEFTLILPDSKPEDAITRAEHLRRAVEAVTVRYGEKTLPRITISPGVAHCPSHGTMPQNLMRAADDALYLAKDKGRNQVQVATYSPLVAEAGPAEDRDVAKRKPCKEAAA